MPYSRVAATAIAVIKTAGLRVCRSGPSRWLPDSRYSVDIFETIGLATMQASVKRRRVAIEVYETNKARGMLCLCSAARLTSASCQRGGSGLSCACLSCCIIFIRQSLPVTDRSLTTASSRRETSRRSLSVHRTKEVTSGTCCRR
jgi:hypothetical protein